MKTLSAVSSGQHKLFSAGGFISFSTAFAIGYSQRLFEPFTNEFYSLLQIAIYLICFSAGALIQPHRKSSKIAFEQLAFTVFINLLVCFLLTRSVKYCAALPVLLLISGRITGLLKKQVLSQRHFSLVCFGSAAAGILFFYLLNSRIPPAVMDHLFLGILLASALIPVWLIRHLAVSNWIRTLLAAGWLLIPLQYILLPAVRYYPGNESVLSTGITEHTAETEIKPAAVIQAQLQPNRKNLKILLIGDSLSMIQQLSNSPLTRKLSSLSISAGMDLYRRLNAEADDFDLIVLQLPLPQSLYAERFYSIHFYQILKNHLTDDGVLAVHLPEELLSYRKNYLNELYGSTGSILGKVFSQVKPSCADPLVLLCGGTNLTNSPVELNSRAEKLLSDSNILPEKAFLMSTDEEQMEQERFFRAEIFRSGGQDGRMSTLLWNAVRNHPLLNRTVLGEIVDHLHEQLLFLLALFAISGLVLRYFFSGGTVNKKHWMTWENGIYTGLTFILFLIPYQQYTGRLSRDWMLLTGFFLFSGSCGLLSAAGKQHSALLLKLLLGPTLLLPLCGFAFLRGYSPEPLVFYGAIGYIGFTAGAVYGAIRSEISLIPAGLAAGLLLGILLFWLPGGTFFAMTLAVLTRIPPVSSENLKKQFDKS